MNPDKEAEVNHAMAQDDYSKVAYETRQNFWWIDADIKLPPATPETDGTPERKLEEWQACYAQLFKHMNDAAQEIVQLKAELKALQDKVVILPEGSEPIGGDVCVDEVLSNYYKLESEDAVQWAIDKKMKIATRNGLPVVIKKVGG